MGIQCVDATTLKTAALALSAAKEVGMWLISNIAATKRASVARGKVKRVQARKHCTKAEAAMPFTSEKMSNS
ncbi:hypothetical protein Tco_0953093 [Tanacetum coccineum]|uniref:Uncharacterized protein n=1 Tax=Tanacetum coccineum TaxID=301880 RepID=A0ABQ5DZB6_9ASTR